MDPLYDVLAPHLPSSSVLSAQESSPYLTRLSTLSLSDLSTTEPASLLHSANTHIRNLQALSKRSHKAVIASSSHLSHLSTLLPTFSVHTSTLRDELPALEDAASQFARKYDRSGANAVLESRKRALLLSRNIDRVTDVLDLPTLLSSTVSAAQASSAASASGSATSYASALDLHAHIRRLSGLYPTSSLVSSVSSQAETEMRNLTTILITTLQSPGLKLAAAIRTIGWLRRVAPDLSSDDSPPPSNLPPSSTKSFDATHSQKSGDGALGTLFLICRLHTLHTTLEALAPLRELADHEAPVPGSSHGGSGGGATGTQSERYLKRYIEIFREQSFGIVSMYKSIFPSHLPSPDTPPGPHSANPTSTEDALLPLPSPLASFSAHLTDLLTRTLETYLPNIGDRGARESLLTQVLYCAGSLGRLGGDFGMVVALLGDEFAEGTEPGSGSEEGRGEVEEEPEWVRVMKKHRVQAGRLEVLSRGVGSGARKGSAEVGSRKGSAEIGREGVAG